MKILLSIFLAAFSLAALASVPVHFTFDRIDVSEGNVNIQAAVTETKINLKYFNVSTQHLDFELGKEILEKVTYPKLNTISYALVPYNLEEDVRYLEEISLSFFGDERCKTDESNWALENKLKIVVSGKEARAFIEYGDCNY